MQQMMKSLQDLADVGGLRDTDIANVTQVDKALVARWEAGKKNPSPRVERVIADLNYVVRKLDDFYESEDIRKWLNSPHPQLDGQRAIDVIRAGQTEQVLSVLDRLDNSVYF